MKGIVLAGGNGRRLEPITNITNKHLLAVYNKPMIYYPLQKLIESGITDILIVSGKEHAGGFLKLLGSGKNLGCKLYYEVQEEAGGIAQALYLAKDFVGDDKCTVILGDNIFEENFKEQVDDFINQKGARIFLKKVTDAERFGVAELKGDTVISIEEKPKKPKSDWAVTGLYMYDPSIFRVIKMLKPSARGELEITDANNVYLKNGELKAYFVKGEWTDAGTFESLYRANRIARKIILAGQGINADQLIED
jgi:glucose-1-phosphate thymidylyltransferase